MKTWLLTLAAGIGMNAAVVAGERPILIELKIEPVLEVPESEKRIFKRPLVETKKAGAEFAITAKIGKSFKKSSFKEFIAPTAYEPFETLGDVKAIHREDGSVLLEASPVSKQKLDSIPVTPANPTAFEASLVGWEVEGTAKFGDDGLVLVTAEIRSHDARAVTSHYGEGTGPIVTAAKNAFGKKVEVVLTENKAQGACTSITKTPIILKARPGVTYPIQVMMADKAVAATIRCVRATD